MVAVTDSISNKEGCSWTGGCSSSSPPSLLIGIALWLGPLIKRFGRSYAADVFRANPRTGKSFIVLTDVAYYLIFFAYILFTVSYEPKGGWDDVVTAAQLQHETARIGGILLIIGCCTGSTCWRCR